MAVKQRVIMVDDLDGAELEQTACETVRFAFEGKQYEIDLGTKNAETFRKVLGKYTGAGRRIVQTRAKRTTVNR